MTRAALAGSRIRARRIDLGRKQSDLARACGISASYLNLIEHNRRRIGGKLLVAIARELSVEPAILSEGAGAAAMHALDVAAGQHAGLEAETDRTEEFIGRFPGWAALVGAQAERIGAMEHTVETLADRLAHDPYLSASLHDVLSTVTSIRSTSAILVDDDGIPKDWQTRFHRNLYEDAQRLAERSQSLVDYLDAGADTSKGLRTPQDELDAWLVAREFAVSEIEENEGIPDEAIIAGADALESSAARDMAAAFLVRYRAEAMSVPLTDLAGAVAELGVDPSAIAARFDADLPVILRRLASLSDDVLPAPLGLVVCDGAGALTLRKEIDGFALPRAGAGCALWPLYQSLAQPTVPVMSQVAMPDTPERRFRAFAVSMPVGRAVFGGPVVREATMLLVPEHRPSDGSPVIPVGTTCRICPRERCPARREPSILAT